MEEKNNKIQKLFTLLSYITFISIIICNGIQTYNSLFGPSAKLRAVIEYSEIRLPNNIAKETNTKYGLKFDGCWSAEVKNRGSISCKDVRLRLPHAILCMIKRENAKPVISNCSYVVSVGDLAPLEQVKVYGWTYGYGGPNFCDKDGITLIHEKGIGRVRLKLPLRDYWFYVSKHWVFIILLPWIFVLSWVIWHTINLVFFVIRNLKNRGP